MRLADQAVERAQGGNEDLETQAHEATKAAVDLASTEQDMAKVDKKVAEAKLLWNRMVEEQVALARAQRGAKVKHVMKREMHENIDRLLNDARSAQQKQNNILEHIKDATSKVSEVNLRVAR